MSSTIYTENQEAMLASAVQLQVTLEILRVVIHSKMLSAGAREGLLRELVPLKENK